MIDLRYFDYMHLPKELRTVSRVMHSAAWMVTSLVPDGPEKSAGMRKLLEAKDCFVRAMIEFEPVPFTQEPVENEFPVRCTRNLVGLPCDCGQCTHIRNVAKDSK